MSKIKCHICLSTCMSFLKGESLSPWGMVGFDYGLLLSLLWSMSVSERREVLPLSIMFVSLACRSGVSVRFVGSLIS